MPVTRDILQSYPAPRRVVTRQIAQGMGEERVFAFLMIACLIMFVAQLPELSRLAHLDPAGGEFAGRASSAFLGSVLYAPIFFYGVAAVSGLIFRAFRRRVPYLYCRHALFWALLAATPLMLLRGLVAGFIGAGVQLSLVALLAGAGFIWIWGGGLTAAFDRTNRTEQVE